jgi:hypothetical protein
MLNRMISTFTLVLLMCCGFVSMAQDDGDGAKPSVEMAKLEDTLFVLTDSIYYAPIPDTRVYYNDKFVKTLVRALKMPSSYNYPFTKLKDRVNLLYSDDKSFRMFNWVIAAPNENNRRYYAAIQMPGEKLKLYGLVDYSDKMNASPEDSVLTDGKWFGALYYRIMTNEVDGQPVYTLFGVNESNPISKRKLLDPMIITERGPKFGAPIFGLTSKKTNQPIQRFVLEYKKSVQVSLNWDDERKAIYYDRLASEQNDPNRKYTFVPSGQYDGFRWQGDKWVHQKDLIPIQELKDGQAPSGTPTTPETKE